MKSKGCAFLEFKHRGALQQGLKLHHSQLDGRQINVELTAGGGGKGTTRMKKLKERNKELEGQRVCNISIVDLMQLMQLSAETARSQGGCTLCGYPAFLGHIWCRANPYPQANLDNW